MIRSYKYSTNLNKGKLTYIENRLYPEWRRISKILINRHMEYLYRNSIICNSNILYKDIQTFLSERYKDSINRQVTGMIRSKYSNFKNRYKKVILGSSLSKEEKLELIEISKSNDIFTTDNKLARWIFRHFFGRIPSVKSINMVLQDKIAKIEVSDLKTKDYVIKLCTEERGKYIYIPLEINNYANGFEGKLNTSSTLCFSSGKLRNVVLSKELEDKEIPNNNIRISMDMGLNILFALNNGETYGRYFCRRLRKLDGEYIQLINRLKIIHGSRVKLSGIKEFTNKVQKIRDYIKNEIGRILNKIYRRHNPSEIIMEDLDFGGSKLSRKFNRLLSKFGLGVIKGKLSQIGCKIKYIDPSYTSQTCSCCGYVDKKNRRSQDRFECRACGYKINADVNGSRNILKFSERFSDGFQACNRVLKRTLIVADFLVDNRGWVDNERIIQVLLKNSYFRDYDMELREKLGKMSMSHLS